MPQNKFALARYYLIDKLLRKHSYVKSVRMVEYCRQITGYQVSQRTIQMDIETMKNDPFLGFHAPIGYSHKMKAYYYAQPDYQLLPFCFTEEEVFFLEKLLHTYRMQMLPEEIDCLCRLLWKMKVFEGDAFFLPTDPR
ncbi:MAG: hypothetical protein LIP08_04390 [Bacteroides sp.]|nr:hypothetical protein [Bacteroides sp.]